MQYTVYNDRYCVGIVFEAPRGSDPNQKVDTRGPFY